MRFEFHSNNYRNIPARNDKFLRKVNHKYIYTFYIKNCGTLTATDMENERKFGVISDTFQSDILYMKTKLNYTTIINCVIHFAIFRYVYAQARAINKFSVLVWTTNYSCKNFN